LNLRRLEIAEVSFFCKSYGSRDFILKNVQTLSQKFLGEYRTWLSHKQESFVAQKPHTLS
jgi:hypothetical protein